MRYTLITLSALMCAPLWSQMTPNTLTVNAYTQSLVSADEAVIALAVTGPAGSTAAQAVDALAAAGITGVQATPTPIRGSISLMPSNPVAVILAARFTLYLTAPVQGIEVTLKRIAQSAAAMKAAKSPYTVQTQSVSTGLSADARANLCAPSSSVPAAQAQAKRVADAAALVLGPVIGAVEPPQSVVSSGIFAVAPAAGDFATFLTTATTTVVPQTCSLNVTFAFSRY